MRFITGILWTMVFCFITKNANTQQQVIEGKNYKNVVRYNISGPLIFGWNYVVLGYERVLGTSQSISVNVGQAVLPKLVTITSDSFFLQRDLKNKGYNFSADYRFYLSKENKYRAPHGLYIGPYYSYNQFKRNNNWTFVNGSNDSSYVTTNMKFIIHTIGGELGYQFVLWKRWTLDFVLIGPGISYYNLNTDIQGNISFAKKTELLDALKELIIQKFPGLNFIFSDQQINSNGKLTKWNVGFRYLVHIGFRF